VRLVRIDGNANDLRVFRGELLEGVAEPARLAGADEGKIAGVEVEDHVLLPEHLGKLEVLPGAGRHVEIGRLLAYGESHRGALNTPRAALTYPKQRALKRDP
jgi:hypothetical protein